MDSTGIPIAVQVLYRSFKKCVSNLGLPYMTPGKLRYVHATMLLLLGTNLKATYRVSLRGLVRHFTARDNTAGVC